MHLVVHSSTERAPTASKPFGDSLGCTCTSGGEITSHIQIVAGKFQGIHGQYATCVEPGAKSAPVGPVPFGDTFSRDSTYCVEEASRVQIISGCRQGVNFST